MTEQAYDVRKLAKRWACSEGVVRAEIRKGNLHSFRIGTLIRISREEIERFEMQNIQSSGSGEDSRSSGETRSEHGGGTPFPRPIASEQMPKHASAGGSGGVIRGPWDE